MKTAGLLFLTVSLSCAACAERLCGLERLLQFDRLPELLEGTRAMQVSSHDRNGQNYDGWFGTYSHLYQDENGEYVLLDERGAGCVYRMWTTFDVNYGMATNRFRVYFDDEILPRIDTTLGSFFSGTNTPFLFPLTGDANVSSGGYFNYVPLPYQQRCKITVSGVRERFYYNFTYHSVDSADGVQTWTGLEDLSDVKRMWSSAGTDPKAYDELPSVSQSLVDIPAFGMTNLFEQSDAGVISVLKIDPGAATESSLTNVWIRMTWDGAAEPQVYVPIGQFFGTGFGEHEVKALPVGMSSTNAYYCYFPMPFWESASIQLENKGAVSSGNFAYEVNIVSNVYDPARCGYFYAKANRQELTPEDRDYIVLDEEGFGHYVGCVLSMTASDPNENLDMRYLEGDERIYIDCNPSPSIYGTGNEDYFNGGWYFRNRPFTLASHGAPYLRHDVGAESRTNSTSAYRFHLGDVIPFRTHIRFGIEHGDSYHQWNLPGTYSSVAFFYKKSVCGQILSARMDVGDAGSEQLFGYHAGDSVLLTNEWSYEGVQDDVLISDSGRQLAGLSSYTVPIAQTNRGVCLRRRTDQRLNPQSAEVFVGGESVGVWALKDSNFTGVTKRWVDSEFEIPWGFTAGKTNLHIRIEPESSSWNEYRYEVYSIVPLVFSTDMDEDGIPDAWESGYFANIRSAFPQQDRDGDGMNMTEEYITGTSPLDPHSVFELTSKGNKFEFLAHSNRIYQVWFCSNLVEGAWVSVTNFQGSETVHSVASGDAPRGFYRVEVQR